MAEIAAKSSSQSAVRRLGYLSAAPTVSTRPDAASAGPRAHIQGVINGFRLASWQVAPFIVGDRIDPQLTTGGVQRRLEGSKLIRLAADMVRLGLGRRNAARAWHELMRGPEGPVDWVYERFATMQVLGHRFARAGRPWILETQGLFYYETRVERASVGLPQLAERIEKHAYRSCDVLVCVTPALRDLIVRECDVDPGKILVVPNAVDLDRFDPSTPAKRFFEDLTVGFIGGLVGWQALDRLMDAIAALQAKGIRMALVVVGDGAMRPAWEEKSRELGIADRVKFVGQVPGPEIGRYVAGIDIGYAGAATMRIGTMYHSPIKLYEYMAMAKPVLAAAFDDARALAEGLGTGFLFNADDHADLVRSLEKVHAQRHLLPEMGKRARALIEAEHTWLVRSRRMIVELERRFDRLAPAPAMLQPGLAMS